eukprot:scaffold840_cov344-Pavlova_lutheri.AAC.72
MAQRCIGPTRDVGVWMEFEGGDGVGDGHVYGRASPSTPHELFGLALVRYGHGRQSIIFLR